MEEDDILRKAKMLFSKEVVSAYEDFKHTSVEIGILNLHSEIYFDDLLKEKGEAVYGQLKAIAEKLEHYDLMSINLDEFKRFCNDNTLILSVAPNEQTNYYELWKKIKEKQPLLHKTYLDFKKRLDDDFKI